MLLDKQAIHEATMRYCRGADRCDTNMINSAYHLDGKDERNGEVLIGAAIGPAIVKSLQSGMQSTNHQIGTQLIEVYGDIAASESYSTGTHILMGGRRLHTLVRYLDRFQRKSGEWRVVHRIVLPEVMEVLPPSDDPQFAPTTPGRRDNSDPSYALFREAQSS